MKLRAMLTVLVDDGGRRFVSQTDVVNEARGVFHGITDKHSVGGTLKVDRERLQEGFAAVMEKNGFTVLPDEEFAKKHREPGVSLITVPGRPRDLSLDETASFDAPR